MPESPRVFFPKIPVLEEEARHVSRSNDAKDIIVPSHSNIGRESQTLERV
jgi:hypothetical protein